jgi:rhodanese-related sulfurtransferase
MSHLADHVRSHSDSYKDVSPDDVGSMSREVHIIDVREPEEFVGELGHVPRSKLVPMNTLLTRAAGWPRDAEYLVVCRSGVRSANCAQAMSRLGFSRVMNLVGGMIAWNAAGKPVER